jgi:cytochrome c2
MRAFGVLAVMLALSAPIVAGAAKAADPEAGKRIFQTICHGCHAALPYTGRIGVENLPKFLANPKAYKPSTAMNFPGLRSRKDIEDVIAYITANQ